MSELTKEPVEPMRLWSGMTVNELVLQMAGSGAFTAGTIAKAVDIYERMVKENAFIFLSLAGALVPAGMRKIFALLIEKGLVHAVVSTGANLVHDFTEAMGGRFYKGSPYLDDDVLYQHRIDRIYDVLISDDEFTKYFDEPLIKMYAEIAQENRGRVLSINDLLREIGKRLPDSDSIIKACYKYDVPLFAPAISDSVFGLIATIYNEKASTPLLVDTFKDLEEMKNLRSKHEKAGAIVLGGGVPKNYVFQSFFFEKKKLEYVIQITLDRPETGGLSGAPPREGVSWGKVKAGASKVVVVSEVTLAFPIIVAALLERLEGK